MAGYEVGLEEVINNIRSLSEKKKGQLVEAAGMIGSTLLIATRENAGLTDLSQEDLNELDNPYSTRLNKNSAPTPDYQVHIQTGLLYENIEQDIMVTPERIRITVGVDENTVPYIADLIMGTSKMRPRDFLTETLIQQKNAVRSIIKAEVGV